MASRSGQKILPLGSIALDLSLLGFFRYPDFTLSSMQGVAGWLGYGLNVPSLDMILPVGISFYTFHTITYIVDSYRGVITPTRNFFEFSAYVSLFAQLVAGPINGFDRSKPISKGR